VTYLSDVSVALLLSASESAATPASSIALWSRLQRGEEGQGVRGETGIEQGARNLLELRQRGVALERVRERHCAHVADLVPRQAAAR
jgi:hypothetical protein